MNDQLQIELLGKLAAAKEISRLLRARKRPFITESIQRKHLAAYVEDGWELDREFKNSVRVKKSKPDDVKFEDDVWSLFANLDFDFMNRDRQFHLPYDKANPSLTQQIDVFAKDSETILLVECKAAQSARLGNFKKELEAMAGKISGLRKTLSGLFPNVKHKIKFIFATRNYSISDEDKARLNNLNAIHFSDDLFEYFSKLFGEIGSAAKYQLLGLLFEGQDIPELDMRVPAVEGSMGGHKYYSFSIEPEKLLKISFVLHRSKANVAMMPTYQRLIKKRRLAAIHDFVESEGYFPNSIVISIEAAKPKDAHFERANTQVENTKSAAGILHLPKKYRSAFIIDGQHRLYGYANSQYRSTNTIPVVAFINLSREEQIKLFIQINENQKSVSKDLQNTLNADSLWGSENLKSQMKALCAAIAIKLGEDSNSRLHDMVAIGEDKRPITTQGFENALKKSSFLGKVSESHVEELGTIYNGNLEQTFDKLSALLKLVFDYIAIGSEEEWKKGSEGMLAINKGIYGIIMITSDVIVHLNETGRITSRKQSAKEIFDEVKYFLDPVVTFLNELTSEQKKEMKSKYGSTGDTIYWRYFQRAVSQVFEGFKPDGMEIWFKERDKAQVNKAFEFLHDIETTMNADFAVMLQDKFGAGWFKRGVPIDVSKQAHALAFEKNLKVENEEEEVSDWDCLNLIHYREIAMKNWQGFFELEYTRPSEEKIPGGSKAKTSWMKDLNEIRNKVMHAQSVSDEEISYLEEVHSWLVRKEIRNKFQYEQENG